MAWLLLFLLAASPYQAEIETWQQARVTALRADKGWLTVAGLFWLKPGENTFGSDTANAIVLPSPAPKRAGVFILSGSTVTVAMDGRTRELRHDSASTVEIGPLTLLAIKRGPRYGIRLRDTNSEYRRNFTRLHYFPIDERYRVTAKWVPSPGKIPIVNVLGQSEPMDSPGYAVFQLNGRELRLYPVLEDAGAKSLFYIFRDQTSTHETYGAGRFLDGPLPKGGTVTLDFNRAYNPPCAFTPYATCPLPPKENRLPVRIEAGELKYGSH